MLEFQGMIEMDGTTWAGNQLGQLSILDGVCTHASFLVYLKADLSKKQATYLWYMLPYLGR